MFDALGSCHDGGVPAEPFRGRSSDRLGCVLSGGRQAGPGPGRIRGTAEMRKAFVRERGSVEASKRSAGTPAIVADDQWARSWRSSRSAAWTEALRGDDVRAGLRRRLRRRIFRRQAAGVLEAKRSGTTALHADRRFLEYRSVDGAMRGIRPPLLEDATDRAGPKYADLLALSYRQAIAAHKLVTDREGRAAVLVQGMLQQRLHGDGGRQLSFRAAVSPVSARLVEAMLGRSSVMRKRLMAVRLRAA